MPPQAAAQADNMLMVAAGKYDTPETDDESITELDFFYNAPEIVISGSVIDHSKYGKL